MKKSALQNKRVGVLRVAFRARKVLEAFEERAPGPNMMRRSVAHNHVNSASDQLRTHLISSKMADWEEIKRLAADFQRAQLSSTAHKLSERNCVEIVQKLIHLGLIEVIYTTDGKEYLTPQQLEREIKDELFVHGGKYLYKCF